MNDKTAKLSYQQIVELATVAARANIKRQLLEMFVYPGDADDRVSQNDKAKTQYWLREYSAMFDAIVIIEGLGYRIVNESVKLDAERYRLIISNAVETSCDSDGEEESYFIHFDDTEPLESVEDAIDRHIRTGSTEHLS